ncbi:hypothetical protein RI367_005427 [Sorochytrium milnesiophthora]
MLKDRLRQLEAQLATPPPQQPLESQRSVSPASTLLLQQHLTPVSQSPPPPNPYLPATPVSQLPPATPSSIQLSLETLSLDVGFAPLSPSEILAYSTVMSIMNPSTHWADVQQQPLALSASPPRQLSFRPDESRRNWSLHSDPIGVAPTALTAHLLELFTDHFSVSCCSFLDVDDVRSGYNLTVSPPIVLYTLYALVAPFSTHPDLLCLFASGEQAGQFYLRKAQAMIGNEVEAVSLGNLQALVLLTHHAYSVGGDNFPTGWLYCGMALRMCEVLFTRNDHQELFEHLPKDQPLHAYGSTLLYAFGQDIMACAVTGRTSAFYSTLSSIVEAMAVKLYAHLPPPSPRSAPAVPYSTMPALVGSPPGTPSSSHIHSTYLVTLLGRILQLVNAPARDMMVNIPRVRELHDALVAFSKWCPIVTMEFTQDMAMSYVTSGLVLLYHATVIILHRPLALAAYLSSASERCLCTGYCLDAADRIVNIAKHLVAVKPSVGVPIVGYALMCAATVYIQRTISVALTAADMAKLQVLIDAMDTLSAMLQSCLQHVYYVREFMRNVLEGQHSDLLVMTARFPQLFGRSDGGWLAFIRYSTLKASQAATRSSTTSSSAAAESSSSPSPLPTAASIAASASPPFPAAAAADFEAALAESSTITPPEISGTPFMLPSREHYELPPVAALDNLQFTAFPTVAGTLPLPPFEPVKY